MKSRIGLLFKTILFLLLFVIAFGMVSLVVERKSSYQKNAVFMEEADQNHLDVFWMGSSHVINAVNPLQLYEEQGITSYNLGGYGAVPKTSYWQLMLALQYTQPKVVVIDTYMLDDDVFYQDDPAANGEFEQIHMNMDSFPLTRTKWNALNDLFESQDVRNEYLFDFMIYHDRWAELTADDVKRLNGSAETNQLMGADLKYAIHHENIAAGGNDDGTSLPSETVGVTYLRKMIEECQQRGIQVVLMMIPFNAQGEDYQSVHTAEQLAQEYNLPCLNMLDMGLVNLNLDMVDAGHVNVIGSEKITTFLGSWMHENLPLEDRRGNPEYTEWDQYLAAFHDSQIHMSKDQSDLYTQLMLLPKSGQSYVLYVQGGVGSYDDPAVRQLIRNLSGTGVVDNAAEVDQPYLLMNDHGGLFEWAGCYEMMEIPSSIGTMQYTPAAPNYGILNLPEDDTNYIYSSDHPYASVQILTFAEDGSGFTSHQYYMKDGNPYTYASN